jgi:simple sugar transport system ATP-binding protein
VTGELNGLLRVRDISRAFPGVLALDRVQLCLRAGEVHALMGQNGAGKSTLIKVLTGACPPNAGTIELAGEIISPASPAEAQRLGISTVYQEVNLCPNLSLAENICTGRYPRRPWRRGGGIDWQAVNGRAQDLLRELDIDVPVTRPVSSYSPAIQQMTTIARALNISSRVLILDEPTSSLDEVEVKRLFTALERLRGQGMAILFVTHFLDQAYAIAERFTVLRNGTFIGEYPAAQLSRDALISAMVGRELDPRNRTLSTLTAAADSATAAADSQHPVVVGASRLGRKGAIHPTDIEFRSHEIVGVAGLLGSGRTELASLVFGLESADSGEIRVGGAKVAFDGPADAIAHGLALCPEERKTDGVLADLSIRENIVLSLQARQGLLPCLSLVDQRVLAERFVTALGIKATSIETPVGQLSGGNQQKVLLARALATAPRLLILDEPTRGVDIVAKQEIMDEVTALAARGMAVMFISSELEEVVRVSDRIVVLCDRRKAGELPGSSDVDAVYSLIARHA